jgi:hypothetical protein
MGVIWISVLSDVLGEYLSTATSPGTDRVHSGAKHTNPRPRLPSSGPKSLTEHILLLMTTHLRTTPLFHFRFLPHPSI